MDQKRRRKAQGIETMMMDDELDQQFTRRLKKLRHHWLLILEGACGCALVALIISLFLPKIYRATTYILVSESKIGAGSKDNAALQMVMLPTFTPFVDNDALISESLKKLRLDGPPYNLTVDRFRRRNYLDVRIPKSTRLLEVNVEFPDPRSAADLVNALAQGAVEFNDRMNLTDTMSTQVFLKKQLDAASDGLNRAAARRVKVQEEARIEDREGELATLLAEKDKLSAQLEQLRLNLSQEQAKSTSLKQALAAEPQTIQLKKSVIADRFLEVATEKLNPQGTPLSMIEESPNKNREEIQRDLISATVTSAAESAGIQAANTRLELLNKEISQLITRLATVRSEVAGAEQEYGLASDAVKNASHEYQTASVTVSSKSQDMKQIAPALVPERPVRPSILLNTIIGFLLGALIFAGIGILIQNRLELNRESAFIEEEGVTL
jgi:capsular polysaccharide biosynthesis protein